MIAHRLFSHIDPLKIESNSTNNQSTMTIAAALYLCVIFYQHHRTSLSLDEVLIKSLKPIKWMLLWTKSQKKVYSGALVIIIINGWTFECNENCINISIKFPNEIKTKLNGKISKINNFTIEKQPRRIFRCERALYVTQSRCPCADYIFYSVYVQQLVLFCMEVKPFLPPSAPPLCDNVRYLFWWSGTLFMFSHSLFG